MTWRNRQHIKNVTEIHIESVYGESVVTMMSGREKFAHEETLFAAEKGIFKGFAAMVNSSVREIAHDYDHCDYDWWKFLRITFFFWLFPPKTIGPISYFPRKLPRSPHSIAQTSDAPRSPREVRFACSPHSKSFQVWLWSKQKYKKNCVRDVLSQMTRTLVFLATMKHTMNATTPRSPRSPRSPLLYRPRAMDACRKPKRNIYVCAVHADFGVNVCLHFAPDEYKRRQHAACLLYIDIHISGHRQTWIIIGILSNDLQTFSPTCARTHGQVK